MMKPADAGALMIPRTSQVVSSRKFFIFPITFIRGVHTHHKAVESPLDTLFHVSLMPDLGPKVNDKLGKRLSHPTWVIQHQPASRLRGALQSVFSRKFRRWRPGRDTDVVGSARQEPAAMGPARPGSRPIPGVVVEAALSSGRVAGVSCDRTQLPPGPRQPATTGRAGEPAATGPERFRCRNR